jgi:hypothetical protein
MRQSYIPANATERQGQKTFRGDALERPRDPGIRFSGRDRIDAMWMTQMTGAMLKRTGRRPSPACQ